MPIRLGIFEALNGVFRLPNPDNRAAWLASENDRMHSHTEVS
jgi:hypothetical protein